MIKMSSSPYIFFRPTLRHMLDFTAAEREPRKDSECQSCVYLLVCKPAEADLAKDGTSRGRDLDCRVRRFRDRAFLRGALPVDDTQHAGDQSDGEDVVSIGKETDACYNDSADMIPPERRLVDLSKRETTALVGIFDMSIVAVDMSEHSALISNLCSIRVRNSLVEVVERRIASNCSCSHHAQVLRVVFTTLGKGQERLGAK